MTPAQLTTISAVTLLVSLGLCGVNVFLVLHSYQPGPARPGYHQPFYAPILGPAAFVELAGILAGLLGLVYALVWHLLRRLRARRDR